MQATASSTLLDQASRSADSVSALVELAAEYLPCQGPIEVFVHHNTLHAFQHQSFHDAVKLGFSRYGAEPYLTEHEYRRLYSVGRIVDTDIEAAIQEDLRAGANETVVGLATRCEIRYAMLRHPLHVGPDAELRWVVAETDALQRFRSRTTHINRARIVSASKRCVDTYEADTDAIEGFDELLKKFRGSKRRWTDATWESFSLSLLWRICYNGVASSALPREPESYVRPRDLLLHATGHDIDREVHELLIRLCAAYVDQGYSDWLLPNRDQGFFEAFLTLYASKTLGLDRWLSQLPDELALYRSQGVTAEQSIESSLASLGIKESDREEFITQSLLALGGWAGMIWQLESGVDWVVHAIPRGSLVGMLAVQLILEKHAILHLGGRVFDDSSSIASITQAAQQQLNTPKSLSCERESFLLFQVAEMLGWTPLELQGLTAGQWDELVNEVGSFTSFERRRIFHEAYERKYHHSALNAFAKHAIHRVAKPRSSDRSTFQIVTCIDDREESFRRHLEEVSPSCETFGAAGFFAVAMYYRGAADGFYKPLCPGVITPDHYVQEDVGYTFEGIHRGRAELRRRLGLASHLFQTRSRTFLGGIFAGIVGPLATAPLVARVLFPHLTARLRRRFGSLLEPPPVTKLQLERFAVEPGPENGHVGYSIDEMAEVVVRLLQDIGLTKSESFSRLFIVCGHGSSSLNNPHESAYCCGACAGKRGGPNARALAEMANDWRVREKISKRGIAIPDDTKFVGAYHNTCDDSVVFYDLDALPSSHRADFEAARSAIEEARRRNAHERCRRFMSAPLSISSNEALRHVEARAQDISQARPEYNHATNALCVVGRRDWSRGLFLDRRAFLTSYDPNIDDEDSSILFRILSAAIPVCAGINLEYYFSCVDHKNYGSGSKLPHNVVSLLGVMEGTSSDLRTGLYEQMVEIHEPLRILFLIETTPEAMLSIMERNPGIAQLCQGGWSHLAVINPEVGAIHVLRDGRFEHLELGGDALEELPSSLACYEGIRANIPFASIAESKELS